MALDASTRRHLELIQATGQGPTSRSLLQVLDRTVTAMGGRTLRRWVQLPLLSLEEIHERQEGIAELVSGGLLRGELRDHLRKVSDMERLTSRAATGTCNPRDLVQLRASLLAVPDLIDALAVATSTPLVWLRESLDPLPEVSSLLHRALVDEPPINLRDGGAIRPGFNAELDELRDTAAGGKEGIARLEAAERERTGIQNLKVGYNSVFGYYIEVSKSNLSKTPSDYHRKQTTANGERFLTPKLKEFEAAVLGAEERAVQLEAALFDQVRSAVAAESTRLLALAGVLARLDALAALAETASANGYVRPTVDKSGEIEIVGGRHPVVEAAGLEPFVPNDLTLGTEDQKLLVITGPNMAGKSTFLRQTALIALMAQIGSFVPAEAARIGLVDRIFTRVGAHDDLAGGQSTFMVEMNESANILNNATADSLIILDEIGRGTSTFDGLSIAWAIVEYLARLGAKTLFATHYHQLNDLEKQLAGVRNYRVLVKEQGHQIVWLRKISPGGTDKSYGIQVARLAGMPDTVIERAQEVLRDLEATGKAQKPGRVSEKTQKVQLTFFEADVHPVVDALKDLDVETLTPIEALTKLAELQKLVKG
jgi:DNA mismatch repair protein MutS